MMKNKVLEFAITRHYFEDSIKFGFDYFKFTLDNLSSSSPEIREEWKSLLNQHYCRSLSSKKAIAKLDKWFMDFVKKNESLDWLEIGALLGRNTLADLFYKIYKYVDDKTYWMLLGYCYTNSYLAFDEKFILKLLFTSKRQHKEYLMNEEERNQYDLLPNEVTIYRGCSVKEIESGDFRLSWTLNKDVAIFFANEYRSNKHLICDVVELVVKKESLLGYFNERQEEEVIYIS
jgi:hypothetical protein